MAVVTADQKMMKFAHRVSGELLQLLQQRCEQAELGPEHAAFVLQYAEGRLCGQQGDRTLSVETVWELMRAETFRPVFVAGYRSERQ